MESRIQINSDVDAKESAKIDQDKTPYSQSYLKSQKIYSLPPRYQNQEFLGKGGIGYVYKALDTILNRPVAFKILQNCLVNKERFLKEAQGIANLDHPNIVKIYDFGETTYCYYTMEYLQGRTLKDVPKTGQKGFPWVARIFQKIAKALQHAHEKGVYHHDIKPSNIYLVNQDQEPKLLDFGLNIGTTVYMPPENFDRKEFDEQGDIYSLGVALYEVLTGVLPYPNEKDSLGTCSYHAAPSPKEKNTEIPDALEAICLKCMEKNRDKRYSSANELADAFQKYLFPEPVCQEQEKEGQITHFTAIQTDKLEGSLFNIEAQAEEIQDSELIQTKEIHQAEVKASIEATNLKNVTGLRAETIDKGARIEIKIKANKTSGKIIGARI
ncbi:MAG: serine/threonine protein kinase [Candidatus Brocadiae bacterium]|nr:serine/threonine protein kinase [Candidatus Brocadiia bacterium]